MSVTAAPGFVGAGIACGIKASGDPDLALVTTDDGRPVTAAAVFTVNKSTAAPVVVSRAHLAATGGRASGVILNSGNANAATGRTGIEEAWQLTCTKPNGQVQSTRDVVVERGETLDLGNACKKAKEQ